MLTIKVLHADNGDSILINFIGDDKKKHNLLIDGGLKRTYQRVLRDEINKICQKNEKIDLLVVTHIDQDHIGGILSLVSDNKLSSDLVSKYWFNSGQIISKYFDTPLAPCRNIPIDNKSIKVSLKQGISLENFLLKSKKWHVLPIESTQKHSLFGAQLTILSPNINGLKKLNSKWETELNIKDSKNISSKGNDYTNSIESLLLNDYKKDSSVPNLSSIAILLENNKKRLLLAGDAHSEEILEGLKTHNLISKTKKLKIDYWKLSHHGSKRSTNTELISAITCQNFIVSTSGRRFNLPNKELLAKIICNPERNIDKKIFFYFNYNNQKLQSIFSIEEQLKYNFKCVFLDKNAVINL